MRALTSMTAHRKNGLFWFSFHIFTATMSSRRHFQSTFTQIAFIHLQHLAPIEQFAGQCGLFNVCASHLNRVSLTFISIASNKWITSKASCTATDWIVINYFTGGILAARVRARIGTFLFNACFVLWTFATNYTFGSTLWRYSNIINLTRAHSVTVYFVTMTVWTAWRWFTRIRIWWWYN